MELFQQYGALGLLLLSLTEASFFPLAPDFLLVPLVVASPERALLLAAIGTVGSSLGGLFGYAVGHFGGRPVLQRFASPDRIEKAESVCDRYGAWGVAFAGFTPLPYKFFTVASGVCHLRLLPFFLACTLSRGARFVLMALLARTFGQRVLDHAGRTGVVLLMVAILAVASCLLIRACRRRRLPQPGAAPADS